MYFVAEDFFTCRNWSYQMVILNSSRSVYDYQHIMTSLALEEHKMKPLALYDVYYFNPSFQFFLQNDETY